MPPATLYQRSETKRKSSNWFEERSFVLKKSEEEKHNILENATNSKIKA